MITRTEGDCHGGGIYPASCKLAIAVRDACPVNARVGPAVYIWEKKSVIFVSEQLKMRSGLENCRLAMFARQKWPSVRCRDGLQGGD
jgi:hypothetical protein